MRRYGWLFLLTGCAITPAATVTPATPSGNATPSTTPSTSPGMPVKPSAGDPFAVHGALREETLAAPPTLDLVAGPFPAAPKGLGASPATCAPFVARKKGGAQISCTDLQSARASLDTALGAADPQKRDAALVDLEACAQLPPGFVRALRAELAPIACADAIVAPLLASPPKDLSGVVHHALTGIALSARLARTGTTPPKLGPPFEKSRVLAFIKGPMSAWIGEQAAEIQELSLTGSRLGYYGKAVVAVEAGLADLRLVEIVRAVPVPDGIGKDPELKGVYEAALDQMLEPRKIRGRDAALVGLQELASIGALRDDRVVRARKLLSVLYAGRRIDALDGLLLPKAETLPASSVEERLAARLPTFYAGLVLDPQASTANGTLRALSERGIPRAMRLALRAQDLPEDARATYARARIGLGQQYWRAVDFDEAAALISHGTAKTRTEEASFYLALALALRGGPDDAAAMIKKPPPETLGIGDTSALDHIARAKPPGPHAGIAAFDAALIRRIAAPRAPDPAVWRDVAVRFREAAALLSDPETHARAQDGAREAEAIASEITK